MAGTNKDTAAPVEAVEAEAPKTRGRKATRDPNGKSISGFFSEEEQKRIAKARFKGEHEQVNDLVRTAVLDYVERLLAE
jgi:hypothetical protein